MNVQVNIANTGPVELARWLEVCFPGTMYSVSAAVSGWQGRIEHGVALQLWDVTSDQLDRILAAYGEDHPEEEAFGVLELPASTVALNPSWRAAA